MQIVKIFPNSKEKQHFSIRKSNGKYFVFEGDKCLRTDLENINSAETEISLIVLSRRNNGLSEVPVTYQKTASITDDSKEEETPLKTKCKQCNSEFEGRKVKGNPKLYCSDKCRTKSANDKYLNKKGVRDLSDRNCKFCKQIFTPKSVNAMNCSVKCSQKSYALQKKLDKQLLKKLDLQPKIDNNIDDKERVKTFPKESGNIYENFQFVEIDNKKDSFEKGVLDANSKNHSLKIGVAKSVDGIILNEAVVNEFHELTEKQMKIDQRISRVKYLANDIIEYIVLWCENNKNFGHFQDYNKMFENLVKMKIVDLTKIELMNVMPELFSYSPSGFCAITTNYDFKDQFPFIMFKERLTQSILNGIIPTEDQFQRASILRMLTSQMYFVKKQFIETKATKKEEEIIDPFNCEEPIIRDYMVGEIMPQNTIDDVMEALNNLFDRVDTIGNTQKYHQELNTKRDASIQEKLKQISDRVSEITKKRRGLFG
jgi:hypothetical protein